MTAPKRWKRRNQRFSAEYNNKLTDQYHIVNNLRVPNSPNMGMQPGMTRPGMQPRPANVTPRPNVRPRVMPTPPPAGNGAQPAPNNPQK